MEISMNKKQRESQLSRENTNSRKLQIYSEIVLQNILESKNIRFESDRKINEKKDVDFQISYKDFTFNIEIKTPEIELRHRQDILLYNLDNRINDFDYRLIEEALVAHIFENSQDSKSYGEFRVLKREETRLFDYLSSLKEKTDNDKNVVNVLFVSLYDEQHFSEYFKFIADRNSEIMKRISLNNEYDKIHIIALACFGKRLIESKFSIDFVMKETECVFIENMKSNQYGKDMYVDRHKILLEVIPNSTLVFNKELDIYRNAEIEKQRLFPAYIISSLNNKTPEFQFDEGIIPINDKCYPYKSLFMKGNNIRYIYVDKPRSLTPAST